MKIADGELRQLLTYDIKLPTETVHGLVADSNQTGRSLLQTVLASKLVNEDALARAQAKRIGIPFIDLQAAPLSSSALHSLPYQIAAKYHVICFDETSTSIKLAMADPRDDNARRAVKDYTQKTVRRYQATNSGLTAAIQQYSRQATPLHFSTKDLVETILEQAARGNSQDIHFEPHGNQLIIRRRLGKSLRVMSTLPLARLRAIISWCKLQSAIDVGNTEQPHHGLFSTVIDGSPYDVMVNTIPVVNGEKMVLRLLSSSQQVPSLKTLGFSAKHQNELSNIIADGRGLVIVAGTNYDAIPTTLASLTKQAADQPHTTVTSIEDVVTYQIPSSTQVTITGALPFSEIVSATIAQGPSTIVTNQLGSSKVAEQLIDFSLTQHLVISGLYASSLFTALTKLTAYPLAPALMAASLRLLIVQHYIQTLCKYCRFEFKPQGPLKKALWQQFSLTTQSQLYRKGQGCRNCDRGYHGSTMTYEWLPVDHELQQLLAGGADKQARKSYLQQKTDFIKQLGSLASKGVIGIDEAIKLAAE